MGSSRSIGAREAAGTAESLMEPVAYLHLTLNFFGFWCYIDSRKLMLRAPVDCNGSKLNVTMYCYIAMTPHLIYTSTST